MMTTLSWARHSLKDRVLLLQASPLLGLLALMAMVLEVICSERRFTGTLCLARPAQQHYFAQGLTLYH